MSTLDIIKKTLSEAEGGGTSVEGKKDLENQKKRAQILLKSADLRLKQQKEREALARQKSAVKEETEELEELSTKKLSDYSDKASDDVHRLDKEGNTKKADKRVDAVVRASEKMTDNGKKLRGTPMKEEEKKMKGDDPCWNGYEMIGKKMKNGKEVPNCVPKEGVKEEVEIYEAKVGDTVSFHHELKAAPGKKVKKSGTVEKVEGDVVHVKVKDKYGVMRHQVKSGDLVKEEIEQIDELSKDTLQRYSDAAHKDFSKNFQHDQNFTGIHSAIRTAMAKTNSGTGGVHSLKGTKKNPLRKHDAVQAGLKTAADALTAARAPFKHKMKVRNQGMDRADARLHKEEVEQMDEASKYQIYHPSYSSAVQHALSQAEKQGFTVDMDDYTQKVAFGPKKPSVGKTNSFSITLMDKTGKISKKKLQMQVYGMEGGKYELNMYTEDLDESQMHTAGETVKHYTADQKTKSGVAKWVAQTIDKKKQEMKEAEEFKQGGKPLEKKFEKSFKSMGVDAKVKMKTTNNVSINEEEKEKPKKSFKDMKKKSEKTSDKDIKAGEKLSGKQEPIDLKPTVDNNK